MKFTINRTLFIEKLEKASATVDTKNSIPALQGVFLDCNSAGMALMGSDGTETVTLVTRFGVEIGDCTEPGKVLFAAAPVLKIIKKFKSEFIGLAHSNNELKIVENAKKQFSFCTMDHEEYPKIKIESGEDWLTMTQDQFVEMANKTLHAIAVSDTRKILTGLALKTVDGEFLCTATDSYRLARLHFDCTRITIEKDGEVVLPSKSLKTALKLFNRESKLEMKLVSDTQLLIRGESIIYQSRLLAGTYPDTSRMIPDGFKIDVQVDRVELKNTLEQLSAFSSSVKISSEGGEFINFIPQNSQVGTASVEIPCNQVEPFTLACNVDYLLQAIQTIQGDSIMLRLINNQRPIVIVDADDKSSTNTQLILPIRV
ncbi:MULTISPECIES: DNA polymerase III subunit beta [unclassified Bacillus (in: firmicutes)]|uniref:DNA polymerase III subunit beta n=1 Tax=unclassified Bacillus (in: firmicutes) TaxID=185979 RepID=UPI000BF4923A|nr:MULTISPECIES: DNA polymerase III subunit beta [unclassified Bacillus (in: firmicutes)]PEU18140.1 DNA polymerase III subunit beta [Bacillus sp. AFS014408]PFW62409.1 DNA polymerase III subunit beta [Bacillus sp. AFS075034]